MTPHDLLTPWWTSDRHRLRPQTGSFGFGPLPSTSCGTFQVVAVTDDMGMGVEHVVVLSVLVLGVLLPLERPERACSSVCAGRISSQPLLWLPSSGQPSGTILRRSGVECRQRISRNTLDSKLEATMCRKYYKHMQRALWVAALLHRNGPPDCQVQHVCGLCVVLSDATDPCKRSARMFESARRPTPRNSLRQLGQETGRDARPHGSPWWAVRPTT